MKKRSLSLCLMAVMLLSLLAGCGGKESGPDGTAGSPDTVGDGGKHILTVMASTASTLNPLMANSAEGNLMTYTQGLLYNHFPNEDKEGSSLKPDLAASEPTDVNGDGLTWHIAIDPNAKWDNGDPITAETFVYSLKMGLDPQLLCTQASLIANNQVTIRNATAYYSGKASWDEVGVRAYDAYTLEITVEDACSRDEIMRHFASYWTAPVHEELFESCLNDTRSSSTYGSSVELTRYSGAFVVETWVKGSTRVLVRNENYLHSDLIKLDGITQAVIQNIATGVQMFQSGKLDWIDLDASTAAQHFENPLFMENYSRYIRQIEICDTNEEKPILANLNFKKAMFYAIDRQAAANLTQTMPANFAVPYTSMVGDSGVRFRELPETQEYLIDNYGYDAALAKEYFDKAMKEEGLDFVELTLVHTSSGTDKLMAEYLQEQFASVFGADRFKLKLRGVPNADRLTTLRNSMTDTEAYELAFGYTSLFATDFNPANIFQVFCSDYTSRKAPYHCDTIDELYALSRLPENRGDDDKIVELTIEMEKAYLDECVAIPIVEDLSQYLIAERVQLALNEPDTALGWGLMFSDVLAD